MIRISLLLISSLLFACNSPAGEKLTIATSANMQFAMDEIIAAFFLETGIDAEKVVSSSGKLTAQIQEGAPFDIFVSADMKYPKVLFDRGMTANQPQIYAQGKLVLWSIDKNKEIGIDALNQQHFRHIAMANPEIAPYGSAAKYVLRQYGLWEIIQDKFVFGESIAQTNQFIVSEAADAGFTAKSVVLSPEMKGKGQWIDIPQNLYPPINQGVIILNRRETLQEEAQKFHDFLFSEKGKEILNTFGYATELQ